MAASFPSVDLMCCLTKHTDSQTVCSSINSLWVVNHNGKKVCVFHRRGHAAICYPLSNLKYASFIPNDIAHLRKSTHVNIMSLGNIFVTCCVLCCSFIILTCGTFSALFLSLTPGTVVGVVIYTGRELRSVMNTSNPRHKVQ